MNDGHGANTLDSKDTNPKDALAAASHRLDLSLFPASAVAYGALAMVEGDQKYGGYNWRVAGVKASVYKAALQRHVDKWFDALEDDDPITGVPHLANALACLGILVDATECGVLIDDRPPRGASATLLPAMEARVRKLVELFPRRAARFTRKDKVGSSA